MLWLPMPFHNLKLHFSSVAAFAAWLSARPKPAWKPSGSVFHNTYRPTEAQWAGLASMVSMQQTYESKGWDRGPHVYLALGSPLPANDGIWVMTSPDLPGIHAGDCNDERFGIEVVGDFAARPMTAAQIDLLADTAAALHRYAGCGPDIIAHRDCMVDRTCPGASAYAQKPRIQSELRARMAAPPPPAPALPAHGLILTHANSLDQLEDILQAGRFPVLKVVTGWGMLGGWLPDSRARACAMSCETIVRTVEGDPSAGHPYPHAHLIPAEIDPWYAIRRSRLLIEIGNEPNITQLGKPDVDPAGYAYQLVRSIAECRRRYPKACIISPALSLNDEASAARWAGSAEFREACLMCDLIGVHAYWHHAPDDTGQLARATRLLAPFSSKPWFLSEYGIHDPATSETVKGQRYAEFVKELPAPYVGATIYHYTAKPLNDDQRAYQFGAAGARAYADALA
jgi:hypothetical protein